MEINDPLDFLGNPTYYFSHRSEIIRKIKLIIKIRWFVSPFVFIILAVSNLIGLSVQQTFSLVPVLINTSLILFLNVIYKFLVKRIADLRPLIYFQLFIDTLHFSLTIYQTGGVTSPFSFLYMGVILASAILVSRMATTFTVGLCIILYSTMITLELTGVLLHKNVFIPLKGMENIRSYVSLTWLFNITSFLAIAFFSTYLFSEIRRQQVMLKDSNKTLNRKVETFMLLYKTSEAINAHTSVKKMINTILSELLTFLNLDRAILYLVKDNSYLKLYKAVHRQEEGKKIPPLNLEIPLNEKAGLTAFTALTNKAINITNPEETKLMNMELAKKVGMNPFALAPLAVKNEVLGVLGIDRNRKNGAISEEEFKILKIFANQAAIAIQCYTRL